MSKVSIEGNSSGTGTFTIASPNSNTNRTLNLPDQTGTLLTSATTTGFPAGSVLQVVQTVLTSTVSTSAASIGTFVAVSGFTVSITPTSSSSKILVLLDANMSTSSTGDQGVMYQLTRGGSAIYIGDSGGNRSRVTGVAPNLDFEFSMPKVSCVYLDSPATTSSTTYGLGVCSTSASRTIYLNRNNNDSDNNYVGRGASSITVMEIAA